MISFNLDIGKITINILSINTLFSKIFEESGILIKTGLAKKIKTYC